MPRHRSFITALVVLATWTMGALPAAGFVRTKTCDSYGRYECEPGESPKPIAWPVRCVEYQINAGGSEQFPSDSDGTIGAELRSEVVEAFQTWNRPECSDFQMVQGPLTNETTSEYREEAGYSEHTNLVVWRDDEWPYARQGAAIFALTRVRYQTSGKIRDADIEINTANFDFEILSESKTGEADPPVDLRNSLTHEVGHLLGLAHSEVEAATMYRSATPGEIEKRRLAKDDLEGLCSVYPIRKSPATCDEPKDFVPDGLREDPPADRPCGCASSKHRPGGSAIAFLVVAIGLVAGRLRGSEA